MSKRILYAAGPGNVIGTFRHWRAGEDDPSQVSVTFSGQFFDVCRSLDAEALVVSFAKDKASLKDGAFELRQVPKPFPNAGGLLYHFGEILNGLRLVWAAVRFRADYLIVAEGSAHWFVLYLLPRRKFKIVPTLHCTLWLPRNAPGWIHRVLNRRFFSHHAYAILSQSRDITRQVLQLTAGIAPPILEFLPSWRRNTFQGIGDPPPAPPFRVLFAGRIERNKGVFNLLEAAKTLRSLPGRNIEFDLCGDGPYLAQLRAETAAAGLTEVFRCHGHCDRKTMRSMLNACHVVVVPTTSDFNEGFNMVVAEAVLAGRPVVTSKACPAVFYLGNAVIEVPAGNAHDDARAYAEAILKLHDFPELYKEKRRICRNYQEQFYDESRSWGAALTQILLGAFPEAGKALPENGFKPEPLAVLPNEAMDHERDQSGIEKTR